MVTPAPVRRLANAAVALAVAGPAVLLGGVAWADDPTPAPADDTATEAPATQPSIGSWIIGGTLLEGTAAQPAAKPAAKPVAKPAAKPAAVTSTRSTTRSTSTRTARTSSPATASDGATALPFTGNRVDALLPIGVTLLVGGVVLTLVARPRRTTTA